MQILAFLVRDGHGVTLSDEQLALALHIAPLAAAVRVQISGTGTDRTRTVDYRTQVADAVADAKRLILATQRAGATLAQKAAARGLQGG